METTCDKCRDIAKQLDIAPDCEENAVLEARLYKHGYIATLIKARKTHVCLECGDPIPPPMSYYAVTRGGGGLGWTKFPEKICTGCIGEHMANKKRF